MADINLTHDEADKFMAMEKRTADEKDWLFPPPFISATFGLDLSRDCHV